MKKPSFEGFFYAIGLIVLNVTVLNQVECLNLNQYLGVKSPKKYGYTVPTPALIIFL